MMSSSYAGKLFKNFYSLSWWKNKAIPFLQGKCQLKLNGLTRLSYSPTDRECELMNEDWDNVIILDACRFDQFERINTIDGELEALTSRGSSTPEFLSNNFFDPPYYNTVYITANPQYRKRNLGDIFHDVIDVWKFGWNDELRTVPPSNVASATKNAAVKYPNKRLIIHFMQPHYPFIGKNSEEIGNHSTLHKIRRVVDGKEATRDYDTVWKKLENGKLSKNDVWDAYDGNLEIVLPYVDKLVNEIEGKTVVTSDHGNLLGEKIFPFINGLYGHPSNVYATELRKVPWLVIESNSKKDITSESPTDISQVESDVISDRLADLGYK